MEKEMIKLSEVLEMCEKYRNEEITQEELEEWGNKIKIAPYISLREKIYRITKILFDLKYTDNIIEKFIEMEKYKFWYITLAYTNIDFNDDDKILEDEDAYDLIFQVLHDWLLNIIALDYDRALKLFESIKSYANILDLEMLLKDISNTDFSKVLEADSKLLEMLQNPEQVEILKNISLLTQTRDEKANADFVENLLKGFENKQKELEKNQTIKNKC